MAGKILIVEDSPEVSELIKEMLSENGYSTDIAANGTEALDKIRKSIPSLILADVIMPEMDGYILFKTLKEDPQFAHIPVIIFTARAKMEDTFKALGVSSFLVKPIDPEKLFAEINKHLEGKAGQEQPASSLPVEGAVDEGVKKVAILGAEKYTLQNMTGQLIKEGCLVKSSEKSADIVREAEQWEPDLILLELSGEYQEPVDQVVGRLNTLIQQKAAQENRVATYNPPIVLYKSEEVEGRANPLSGRKSDTEALLKRCYAKGEAKYIGSYSAVSFAFKVRVFLN